MSLAAAHSTSVSLAAKHEQHWHWSLKLGMLDGLVLCTVKSFAIRS
jgi:hypothetical protein